MCRHEPIADSRLMCDSVPTSFVRPVTLCFLFTKRKISINFAIEPLLALVMGILILLVPIFLNYFVAVYLIVSGVLGLMHR